MLRRLVVLAALVLPSSALAAYPTPYAQQGNPGVLSTDGAVRFVAYDAPGATTTLAAVDASDGSRLRSSTLPGSGEKCSHGITRCSPTPFAKPRRKKQK